MAHRPPHSWAAITAPWLIVTTLVWVGLSPTLTDGVTATADATSFSAERAMRHIRAIATAPHPMGSSEIERVRTYIVAELESLGLEIDVQTVPAPDVFGTGDMVDVVNIIGWIPGTANSRAVVLMGHYDTVPTTPGANDDSSAVGVLLETASALRSGPPPANDIVFLFTDGEEPFGRFGASAFAAIPGMMERLGLVVNFETNGSSGASLLVETSGPERWLIEHYVAAAPHPSAYSFLTETARLFGDIGTDFDVFRNAGVPGLHLAYVRGSPIYHTPADDVASINAGSVEHHGTHALGIARHFGDLDLAQVPDSDGAVYFTVARFVIRYPARWAFLPAALAALVCVVALSKGRRADVEAVKGVVRVTVVLLAAALAAATAGALVWMGLVALRSTPGVIESYVYGGAILLMAALGARTIAGRIGRPTDDDSRYGAVVVWVLLGLATAVTLAGWSYLFAWPALAAAGGLLWRPRRWAGALMRFAVVTAFAVLLVTPAADVFFSMAQPRPGNPDSEITAVVIVPLFLTLLAAALLTCGWHQPDVAVPTVSRRPPDSVPVTTTARSRQVV